MDALVKPEKVYASNCRRLKLFATKIIIKTNVLDLIFISIMNS